MPRTTTGGRLAPGWWVGSVVVVTVLLAIGIWATISGPQQEPASIESPAASSSAPPSPTLLPAAEPPVGVEDRASLTLPEEVRLAAGTMYLRAGESYLVRFDLSTVKPRSASGVGMYLGVSFSCVTADGTGAGSIGGTENLVPGEPVSYRNTLVLEPRKDGIHRCNVLANAPYDNVGAKGTTVQLDAYWRVDRIAEGDAVEQADADQTLPRLLPADESSVVLEQTVTARPQDVVTALATVHMTTCTGVNGSREQGRTWCRTSAIDERGNTVSARLLIDLVDSSGKVCDHLADETRTVGIDKWVHHDLLSFDEVGAMPTEPCSRTARVRIQLTNSGPAGLVVHGKNSSLVAVSTETSLRSL